MHLNTNDVPGTLLMCTYSFDLYSDPVGHYNYYHSRYTDGKTKALKVKEIAQDHS